jgi:hypothetical protein
VVGDARQHMAQICLRVDSVQATGADQTVHAQHFGSRDQQFVASTPCVGTTNSWRRRLEYNQLVSVQTRGRRSTSRSWDPFPAWSRSRKPLFGAQECIPPSRAVVFGR